MDLLVKGEGRIEWAARRMPVLSAIRHRFAEERPLEGIRLGACLHVTTETANLMLALKDGGAQVALCASNPLSTQDDVALALRESFSIEVHAQRGVDNHTYYRHVRAVASTKPHVTMDDGADLVAALHGEPSQWSSEVMAGTEETTTGVNRLRAMAEDGALRYPIIAVNDALTKHMFDNRYGTGQSTIDGILRATNILLAGRVFVVAGYGWCGKGLSSRARGMGARVMVVEADPLRALEAAMDGYQVGSMEEAASVGDVFVTVTGNRGVIDTRHFGLMKDGAILANSGHFDVEIDVEALAGVTRRSPGVREGVSEYEMPDGRRLYVLGDGRLINLAAAEGHPAEVMDMSFANQALAVEWLVKERPALENRVYGVPLEIDREVARLKMLAMGMRVEELTESQREYMGSWNMGT
jgi:adenosylhomocysteinase